MKPTKLQDLMVYVLNTLEHEVGSIELAKILYLIDAEKISLFGKSVTDEEYTRQKKGPLARNFQTAIDEMDGFEVKVVIVPTSGKTGIPKKSHSLGDNLRFESKLDETDLIAANRVISRVKGLTPIQLEALAYATEPMRVVLGKEEKVGHPIIGEVVDLGHVTSHPSIVRWRENMKKAEKIDPEYAEYLRVEREEIDSLLSSLG